MFLTLFTQISLAQSTNLEDGYLTYSTENHPKANGLKITMKYPSNWEKEEGYLPHIVQKFSNISNDKSIMIYIAECELENATTSEEDMKEFANQFDSSLLSKYLPANAKVTKKSTTAISGLPAALVEYNFSIEDSGYYFYCEYVTCVFFFNDNIVMIMGSVADLDSNKSVVKQRMRSLKPVFLNMINSINIHNEIRNHSDDSSMDGSLLLVGFIMIILISIIIYKKTEPKQNKVNHNTIVDTDKAEQNTKNDEIINLAKMISDNCFSMVKSIETKDKNQKRELTILIIVAHRLGIQFSPGDRKRKYMILQQFDSYKYSKSRDVDRLCDQRGEVYFNMLNNNITEINKHNWRPFYEELSLEFPQFCLGREQNGPVIITGNIFENLLLGGYAYKLFAMSFSTTRKILIDYNDKI